MVGSGGDMESDNSVLMVDFSDILKDVPEGDWISISIKDHRLLAYGPDFKKVQEAAPGGFLARKFSGTLILDA
jgi:hypothetical protein